MTALSRATVDWYCATDLAFSMTMAACAAKAESKATSSFRKCRSCRVLANRAPSTWPRTWRGTPSSPRMFSDLEAASAVGSWINDDSDW